MIRRKNVFLLVLLLVCLLVVWWARRGYGPEGSMARLSPPALFLVVEDIEEGLPMDTLNQLLVKEGFILAYNEEFEQPAWASYILTRAMIDEGEEPRSDNFREDTLVWTGSATLADYYLSGFDRGHIVPAADMKWSATAMSESFLMSNMSPQVPAFNRGIWSRLEKMVREWAVSEERIYVVTGPVLQAVDSFIGPNKVGVPSHFFKAVLDLSPPDYKAIAFILPNRSVAGNLFDYAVTVDSLENLLGVDLFPSQDKATMDWLESRLEVEMW